MKDRIFNHWKSTVQGLIIVLFALCLVISKLATYTEVSGLFVISLILIFSKNNWLRKFFNKMPFLVMVLTLFYSCRTVEKTETVYKYKTDSIYIDTSKFEINRLQSYISVLKSKNYTIYKTDTIFKVDSLYFRVPVTKIVYKDETKIIDSSNYYRELYLKAVKAQNTKEAENFKKEVFKKFTLTDHFNLAFIVIAISLLIIMLSRIKKRL